MMDQSYSESDLSLSPSQILERLQVLRQLQLMQRGKLQKQRLHFQETSETSSRVTEIVSQFSSSTSYNTFRSSLQTSRETSNEVTPRLETDCLTQKVKENDLIDGVSVLNLSQESEYIIKSPISSKSRVSDASKISAENSPINKVSEPKPTGKKQISLEEMPVLTTNKNLEVLALEKIVDVKDSQKSQGPKKDEKFSNADELSNISKKPFLKRGQGTSRFGIQKNNIVIQPTKSLPWRQRNSKINNYGKPPLQKTIKNKDKEKVDVQIMVDNTKETKNIMKKTQPNVMKKTQLINKPSKCTDESKKSNESQKQETNKEFLVDSSNCELHGAQKISPTIKPPIRKHPLLQETNRGQTWATVLTKEQNDFLRQLKQSDFYKNFASPAKSIVSDISCDENMAKLKQEREHAEQNLFELLENKVNRESFSIDNSFFNKLLKRTQLECSGESTPLILQKCLARNPNLLHLVSDLTNDNSQSQCQSEMDDDSSDCCSEDCCSVSSSCCSCKTVESKNCVVEKNPQTKKNMLQNPVQNKQTNIKLQQKVLHKEQKVSSEQKDIEKEDDKGDTDNDIIKANMAEMNAKLVATSELLKERLQELEDEIETFRKENSNLAKLREEIEVERQKFYEEKSAFEQKFNEEKILSEYYLAEEKEKLTKQKQMYERYVREMRGRLNKKEKDEIINLRKEIQDLKEEIKIKDAKSTSTIARLRNHVKIMEREKKDLQESVEKLKKENRRIQHSNDITRRLTNMKYLEQINKKLSHISSKDNTRSEQDVDAKYKAFEIEKQSRGRKLKPSHRDRVRPRAKSAPNLNVTSRYAKYFSQRDAVSQMERDLALNIEGSNIYHSPYHYDSDSDRIEELKNSDSGKSNDESDNENQNSLEKIYLERFQSSPENSNRFSFNNPSGVSDNQSLKVNPDGYFLRKSNSDSSKDINSPSDNVSPFQNLLNSRSNTIRSKSPISILNRRSNEHISLERVKETCNIPNSESNSQRSKSPVYILSNHSSTNQKHPTISHDQFRDKLITVSPEPTNTTSKTSLTKTNLNPTEFKKPDGSRELRFPNGNVKYISADGKYCKFVYYNGDIKENFYDEGRIKYYYAEAKTIHTTHPDGLEVLEFPDGQVEKRYKDNSTEIRLPNGSIRYHDPKNAHVREEWRFPDGTALTVAATGERRVTFPGGQVEVHAADHKRREFPDGTVKLVYNDGTSETRYASGRVRIKDKHGNLIMDSAS